jgi:hypothetical protein
LQCWKAGGQSIKKELITHHPFRVWTLLLLSLLVQLMAKPLVFKFKGTEIPFQLNKVDRSKLYGYKDLEVLDEAGQKCDLATLGEDGRTIVGKGGTAIGYLSADGLWCNKQQLQPVDLEGQPISPVPSSFSQPIELTQTVSVEEYLDHSIRSIYAMEPDGEIADEELRQTLIGGTIYKFPYSYRGGLEADAGFLLANFEDQIFFAVGQQTKIQFIGLQQTAAIVQEESGDDASDDSDMMDFDMI